MKINLYSVINTLDPATAQHGGNYDRDYSADVTARVGQLIEDGKVTGRCEPHGDSGAIGVHASARVFNLVSKGLI